MATLKTAFYNIIRQTMQGDVLLSQVLNGYYDECLPDDGASYPYVIAEIADCISRPVLSTTRRLFSMALTVTLYNTGETMAGNTEIAEAIVQCLTRAVLQESVYEFLCTERSALFMQETAEEQTILQEKIAFFVIAGVSNASL